MRKIALLSFVAAIFSFYIWIIYAATKIEIPDHDHPIRFYSNQTRQDLKLTYLKSLQKAEQSIYLSVYGITDLQLIDVLRKRAQDNIFIRLEYDPSASVDLKKLLPASLEIKPIKSKGLMHRKIAIIDQRKVFLGSANLTPSSLKYHANLVMGFDHPELAHFLENPSSGSLCFNIGEQKGELFLFPNPARTGIARLLEAIGKAQKQIKIAMFTLTHPEIVNALLSAKTRGVDVYVAIDMYTARGASKKAVEVLKKGGVKFFLSRGKELLHHKWAIVDNETFVLGSANWTKAAFNKNEDFLLFLYPLTQQQKCFLNKLWKIIEIESNNMILSD